MDRKSAIRAIYKDAYNYSVQSVMYKERKMLRMGGVSVGDIDRMMESRPYVNRDYLEEIWQLFAEYWTFTKKPPNAESQLPYYSYTRILSPDEIKRAWEAGSLGEPYPDI